MNVLAFDFGASSGRAILGSLKDGTITLEEVHRFDNDPVQANGVFQWDVLRLFHEIKQGLLKAQKAGGFESIGIDTWGVDYGAFTKNQRLLENPYHYRDLRTVDTPDAVRKIISDQELYEISGNQIMNINTLFQLYVYKEQSPELYNLTDSILLIPDLFNYFLCGEKAAEVSIASTTQLLEPYGKDWNWPLIERLGLKKEMFPPVVKPGTVIGLLKDELCRELGLDAKKIVAVPEHDTASAVAAVPTQDKDFVFISCGTWSLFGTELDTPCISEKSAAYNITNEVGYGDTSRFLKNIIGLWMIQETRRQFKREGKDYSYALMEQLAREAKPFQCFIDPDDPVFTPPGNQPERIKEFCRRTGQYVPQTDGEVIRCIYESLAMKYKYTFELLKECTGKSFKTIHMVGGGTKDGFLCQMTADATQTPVKAGPIEGTAAGNVAVQLIAAGEIKDIWEARRLIGESFPIKEYEPGDDSWDKEYDRFVSVIQ